jgi:glycosyltransferase involved in cell wall biosynthesis
MFSQQAGNVLVSVVLATYNGERFLQQQLASVVAQTHPHLEIIVVDDASTDSTESIVRSFMEKYSHISFHKSASNIGYIKNFERGCQLAKGAFIALCDQDDAWHPEKISKQLQAIGTHAMVYCDSILADEQLQPIGANISDRANCINFTSCLQQAVVCRIYGHATLIPNHVMQQAFPFPDIIPHDWWLCFIATLHGGICYLPEPLAYYRQHANNVFGAAGGKTRKHNKIDKAAKRKKELEKIKQRMQLFYNTCPNDLQKEKAFLYKLNKTYQSFSLANNFQRMMLFFGNYSMLLASKKRSTFRKWLFCLKMFVKMA